MKITWNCDEIKVIKTDVVTSTEFQNITEQHLL